DRNAGSAEFNRVECIARSLFNIDVSGHDRDRCNSDVGRTKSHDERHSIVGGSVGIDQEWARHARKDTRAGLGFLGNLVLRMRVERDRVWGFQDLMRLLRRKNEGSMKDL